MTRHFCRAFVFAFLAITAIALPISSSSASSLPPAVSSYDVFVASDHLPFPSKSGGGVGVTGNVALTSQTPQDPLRVFATASAAAELNPNGDPAVGASVFGDCNLIVSCSSASASLTYSFELVGPAGPTLVPVDYRAGISASMQPAIIDNGIPTAFSDAFASFSLTGPNVDVNKSVGVQGTFNPHHTLGQFLMLDDKISIPVDTAITVGISARADSYINGSDTAGTDPFFFIDPAFANASDYSLVFSDGVGDAPPSVVPLPASLPMFGIALLALGAFAWRRRGQRA
jgi:hypothetical protein